MLYVSPIVGNIQEGNFQRYSLTAGEMLRFPAGQWWSNARFIAGAADLPWLDFDGDRHCRDDPGLRPAGTRGEALATLWTVALPFFVFTANLLPLLRLLLLLVLASDAYLLTAMARSCACV